MPFLMQRCAPLSSHTRKWWVVASKGEGCKSQRPIRVRLCFTWLIREPMKCCAVPPYVVAVMRPLKSEVLFCNNLDRELNSGSLWFTLSVFARFFKAESVVFYEQQNIMRVRSPSDKETLLSCFLLFSVQWRGSQTAFLYIFYVFSTHFHLFYTCIYTFDY